MPRGGPAMPFEQLVPYYRGVRFAVLALKRRHGERDPELAADADRYVAMIDQYSKAVVETFRMKRDREGGQGS